MPRQERERRYIAEYMMETYPQGNYQLNVPLGPVPEELVSRYGYAKAAAMFQPTRLRVDAVHWSPERYLLIESKLRSIKDGIGDLLIYQRIAPRTPDLPNYEGQPVKLALVVPYMVEWIRDITAATNVEYIVYVKEWIEEYARERLNYHTAEYRQKRRELMELRQVLGVD